MRVAMMKSTENEAGTAFQLHMGPTPPGLYETALGMTKTYLRPGKLVADLCAGDGTFSSLLLNAGYQVVPVDGDTQWFRASGLSALKLDLNDSFADLLGPGRFDCVVCLEGIEHLENPWQFIRQCRHLLRPEGILLLSTPNVECLLSRVLFLRDGSLANFDRTMTHSEHITPILSWLLEHSLKQNGFVTTETGFTSSGWEGRRTWKCRLVTSIVRALSPVLDPSLVGETRLLVARIAQLVAVWLLLGKSLLEVGT